MKFLSSSTPALGWIVEPSTSQSAKQGRYGIRKRQEGKMGWILLWLVGIPVPILFILFLLRGCT